MSSGSGEHREASASLRVRLILPLMVVLTITVVGTVGYRWLGEEQGATWADALFMTIITITTVGYGEVIRLDDWGRLFTIFIAITGIGSLFYSLTVIMDYLVMIRLSDPRGARHMQRQIEKLRNHIIIAGLGRVGRQAAAELEAAKVPFIIVDPRPEARDYAEQHGYLVTQGDASDDEVLERAGIKSAKGLIVTSGDDASNLYIVLSARVLRPDLFIVSRAVADSSVPKLKRAGADRAISPYAIGGRRLAHLILSPTVVDFFDTVITPANGAESLNLEGIKVREDSRVVGQTLAASGILEANGAAILVVLRGGRVLPNPDPEMVLVGDDQLLALGTSEQLDRLEALISG